MSTSLSPRSAATIHPTRQQLDELDALLQRMLDLPVNQLDEAETSEETQPPIQQQDRPPVSYTIPLTDPLLRLEPRVVPETVEPEEETLASPPPPPPAPLPPSPEPEPAVRREPGPDDWVRLASTWQPSAQTWQPLAQSWQQARPATRPAGPPAPPPVTPAVTQPIPPALQEPAAPPAFSNPFVAPKEAGVPQEFSASPPETPVSSSIFSDVEESLEDAIIPPVDILPARSRATPTPKNEESTPAYSWWQWPFVAINLCFDVLTMLLGPLGAGLRSRVGRNLLAALGILCFAAAIVLAVADRIGWTW